MARHTFRTTTLSLALLALPLTAIADGEEHGLPLRYQARPLTLPKSELSLDAGFTYAQISIELVGETETESALAFEAGAAFGITDDLQVDALVLPLLLDPELRYENPSLGATYRFLSGDFELGASAHFVIPVEEGSDFTMPLGVPVLLRIGRSARLDTGLVWSMIFADEFTYAIGIPVALTFQAMDALFLGVRTGLTWSEFEVGDTAVTPLGFLAGYSLPGPNGQAMLDLMVSFDFPFMFTWGKAYPDTTWTDLWTLTFGGQFHFGLGGGGGSAAAE